VNRCRRVRPLRCRFTSHNILRMKALAELDALLLAVIRDRDRPCHGNDIGREVESRVQRRIAVATLYRALHRLEDAGYLTAHWEAEGAARQPHRGPKRRYYELNQTGLVALSEYMRQFSRRAGVLGWASGSRQ
jgi:DNA-binding PadR family transcriptional regulator